MVKEQLVKIDPKNLMACSVELYFLLKNKLKDEPIRLNVGIYGNLVGPLFVEIENASSGNVTLCEGYFERNVSFVWERKNIKSVTQNQLAKIERWVKRYMEELATYYEEEIKK